MERAYKVYFPPRSAPDVDKSDFLNLRAVAISPERAIEVVRKMLERLDSSLGMNAPERDTSRWYAEEIEL
ncbi:hypothetical protein Dxin01_00134 [Deinococcus xinjiangensis]|uniref:Uncharacterized protein n=1 Tax=Deinococcus xinjiangensis TaxID=457454 RepID=A0ABP9V548_9DEIO